MIKNRHLKRTAITMVLFVVSPFLAFAQTVSIYIVKKGDTIESISKRKSVSIETLLNLNPEASRGVYEGMELQIPNEKGQEFKEKHDVQQYDSNVVTESEDKGKWVMSYEVGYGFLDKEEGTSGSAYEYRATIGANYVLPYGLYSGIRIGYNSSNYYSHAYANKTNYSGEVTCHLLCIPLELGYRATFNSNKNVGIAPFAGIDLNVGISGKQKIKINKTEESQNLEIGGKLGVGARVGLRLLLWGFDVTGSYVFPLNEKQKGYFGEKSYPEISFGCGF